MFYAYYSVCQFATIRTQRDGERSFLLFLFIMWQQMHARGRQTVNNEKDVKPQTLQIILCS